MQPQFSQLNQDEQEVFRLYKGNSPYAGELCFADHVNQSLRQRQALSNEWLKKIAILDAIIARATIDEELRLFRATIDPFVAPYIKGDHFVYPAYMSTAEDEIGLERHFSGSFQNISAALLHIDCPIRAIALDLETNPAFGEHEREFLLPRESTFVVRDIEKITDRDDMNKRMSELYAKNYDSLNIYKLEYVVRA